MPDLFNLLGRWWKQVITIVIIAVVAVGVVTFLQTKQYLSVATAIPSSSVGTDRSRIFGENLQSLYSPLGSPDDLDRVIGTAQLDTVYRTLADELKLGKHYEITGTKVPVRNEAATRLKKCTKVLKSAYGELKVQVWDKDPVMAARLANSVLQILQDIHTNLNSTGNSNILKGLLDARVKMAMYADSAGTGSVTQDQAALYDKLINQYQVLLDTKPPAMVVVEEASPAAKPDKPRFLRAIVAAAFFSFLFALLLVLILDRRSKPAKV